MHLLLEADGAETGVEGTDTLVLHHLAEARDETRGIGGLRDETDTGGLEGAQGNIGEELGERGRGEVDGGAVVGGSLVAEEVDGLLLEELVTTELQGALEEVTGEGRTDTGQEGTGTLILDNLAEATDEAAVVGNGVELDTGLDAVFGGGSRSARNVWKQAAREAAAVVFALPLCPWQQGKSSKNVHIDRREGTVRDRAADGTSEGETRVQGEAGRGNRLRGLSLLDDSFNLGGHCERRIE